MSEHRHRNISWRGRSRGDAELAHDLADRGNRGAHRIAIQPMRNLSAWV